MNPLERIQARLLLGIQAELIACFLEEDHNLTPEKEANWRKLMDTLTKVNLCFHDMEEEMTRTRNDLGDHRMRVLEDAERIGQLKHQVDALKTESKNIKESLQKAIDLLESNQINPTKLWRI